MLTNILQYINKLAIQSIFSAICIAKSADIDIETGEREIRISKNGKKLFKITFLRCKLKNKNKEKVLEIHLQFVPKIF